jgi:uncharacterized Tic20 family protein
MSNEMPPPPPFMENSGQPASTPNENNLSVLSHAGTLINFIGLPGILVPLVIMLTGGKTSSRVRANAVESLNFQISMIIYAVISVVLMIVLIGFVTIIVVGGFTLIAPIIAAVKASNGENFKYPVTIRMVK